MEKSFCTSLATPSQTQKTKTKKPQHLKNGVRTRRNHEMLPQVRIQSKQGVIWDKTQRRTRATECEMQALEKGCNLGAILRQKAQNHCCGATLLSPKLNQEANIPRSGWPLICSYFLTYNVA